MSKFQMKGYPEHYTGKQDKSLFKFIGQIAGSEDYSKFNPFNPFANSEYAGVFSARGEYDAISSY